MKRTRVAFDDIKAGDLIESVDNVHGVKWVLTGVAFEVFGLGGEREWRTSQGGVILDESDPEIYRIDVAEVKFEDIRKGDRIRVTMESLSGRKEIVEDTVETLVVGMNPFWTNSEPDTVIFQRFWDGDGQKRTIEIVEREGE